MFCFVLTQKCEFFNLLKGKEGRSKMSRIETVAVDVGYGFVKGISSTGNKILFPSVVGSGRERGIAGFIDHTLNTNENDLTELHLKIDGKHFYVGEMALRNSSDPTRIFDRERYNHEYSKILMQSAIQLVTNPETTEVILFTGLPLDYYRTQHEEFKQKLLGDSLNIEWVSGYKERKQRKVKISHVGIFPQGMSAVWSTLMNHDGRTFKKDMLEEGNTIALIDIGFRTTDICVVEMKDGGGFIPLLQYSETVDQGVYNLYENIKIAYQNKTGGSDLSENKINRILKRQSITYKGKNVDLSNEVEHAYEAVLNSIVDRINKLWKEEADTFDYIFVVGGGGSLFLDKLSNKLNNRLLSIVDSQYANAIGYYRIGKMLYQVILAEMIAT